MKQENVKSIVLLNELDSWELVILEMPGKRIKVLADNGGLLDELKLERKPKTFEEAIEKAKKEIEIEIERDKLLSNKNLSTKEVFKIEDDFGNRIEAVWAQVI